MVDALLLNLVLFLPLAGMLALTALPATAPGNNVFVSWGMGGGLVQVTGTDPTTGCTSIATYSPDPCTQ